jgi:SAM-dependent methyltransferase
VTAWVHELAAGRSPRRILDLGSGTGTGALALARRFTEADIIAVDMSAGLLGHLADKARAAGVAGRIHAVQADLDAGWPDVGSVDLVWASASLHHLSDPDRVLAGVLAALSPGGLLAVAELDSFPRFLPGDPGRSPGDPGRSPGDPADPGPGSLAGLEARCHAALAAGLAGEVPHLGGDWGPRLSRAGFTIEAERHFDIDLGPPLPAAAGRYAQASLRRMRSALGGQISTGDLAALDALIDGDGPGGVLQREDLTVRAARTVWMARRP